MKCWDELIVWGICWVISEGKHLFSFSKAVAYIHIHFIGMIIVECIFVYSLYCGSEKNLMNCKYSKPVSVSNIYITEQCLNLIQIMGQHCAREEPTTEPV